MSASNQAANAERLSEAMIEAGMYCEILHIDRLFSATETVCKLQHTISEKPGTAAI